MSKTKTKRARRELKREGHRKLAASHRKAEKAAAAAAAPAASSKTKTTRSNATSPAKKSKIKTPNPKPQTTPKSTMQASQKHNVPFSEYDHILLVGEGDFSFTKSLVEEHGCANVTATSLDTDSEVREKYPGFSAIHGELSALSPPVPFHYGIDATRVSSYKLLRCEREDDHDDYDGSIGKEGWDTICFMFPHTGGLSTDVNRQVRANQALIVSFFNSCLDTPTPAKRLQILQAQSEPSSKVAAPRPFLRMGGKIVVALFEGEPYTLWNIRDLARHVGLKVVESWKLDWAQYPAYRHVRTLGAIEGGGAWRGEDRDARMFVFEKVPLVADPDEEKELGRQAGSKKGGVLSLKKKQGSMGKKRAREETGDEENDDDD